MKFRILHEITNRMRIHVVQNRMSCEQADILLYYLQSMKYVEKAKVYERTGDAIIEYTCERESLILQLQKFKYDKVVLPSGLLENSSRIMNNEYQEKLVDMVISHYVRKYFLPYPIRTLYTLWKAGAYVYAGIKSLTKRKIEVAVLDATAITVSIMRNDIATAASTMFMLGIGELLEDWTHKKSVSDLARTMSLNVNSVWLVTKEGQIKVPTSEVKRDDTIRIHAGNVIPFDGKIVDGEAMINQASLTGEPISVRKTRNGVVYAGTTLEEGELTIQVSGGEGSSKYEKIVSMIENTEKLKSGVECKAEHLADRLVPYCLGGTLFTYLLTKNINKALSVLMVDYSCALKLAMPVTMLSAIREAGNHHITVKGGKYLEAVAEADTIVFDKTGTLTKAQPTVVKIISFNENSEEELLRIAACLEEHFPHSMAKAVVEEAKRKKLVHEEMHSKVEYIVAHGIASTIENVRVVIGSAHFVFEDEMCKIPKEKMKLFENLPEQYSHLYMAMDGELAAVICIADPLRYEATGVVRRLQELGLKVVMMTGDSDRTAKAIAKQLWLDEYYSEVLPEDKAEFVKKERLNGKTVIMIGDGINDSPALSAANVGVAISDGAELAKEIADITIEAETLKEIVMLKELSNVLVRRIKGNYRKIIGFNSLLIALGIGGVIQPTTSALLHNASTILIGMNGMTELLPDNKI